MKTLAVALLSAALLGFVVSLVCLGRRPSPGGAPGPGRPVAQAAEIPAAPQRVEPEPVDRIPEPAAAMRTAVVPMTASPEIPDLQEALDACRRENADLRRRIGELELEVARLQEPSSTPFGAFLLSPEAELFTEKERSLLRAECFDLFPVFLRPGEATWILDRMRQNDIGAYAPTWDEMIAAYLGATRLEAELSAEAFTRVREHFDDEEWARICGR